MKKMIKFDLRLDGQFYYEEEKVAADPVLALAAKRTGFKKEGGLEVSAATAKSAFRKLFGVTWGDPIGLGDDFPEFLESPSGGAHSLCGRYEIVPETRW